MSFRIQVGSEIVEEVQNLSAALFAAERISASGREKIVDIHEGGKRIASVCMQCKVLSRLGERPRPVKMEVVAGYV